MRSLLLLVAFSVAIAASAQQTVQISGRLRSLAKGDKIFISKSIGGKWQDSIVAKGKSFILSIPVEKPNYYQLTVVGKTTKTIDLYLQPGTVKLKGSSLDDVRLSGSPFIQDLSRFSETLKKHTVLGKFDALRKQFTEAYRKKDTAVSRKINMEMRRIAHAADSARVMLAGNWLQEHPQSDINAYVLYMYLRRKKTLGELESMLNGLSATAKKSAPAEAMYHSISAVKMTAIGQIAPDFTQNDPDGRPVSLKDLRGKYVLVDFWASWCGPCRAENPNVVAAYKKFINKNFTVLGVSLDFKKEKWLEAIEKDSLDWTHVSDLQFWDNAIARQYDINAVPANLLIDPSGKIVGKNLRGKALHTALENLLN